MPGTSGTLFSPLAVFLHAHIVALSDAAVPADSGATALGPSSYPPPLAQAGGASPEKDLEELMLMEAIRLSLMESGGTLLPPSAVAPLTLLRHQRPEQQAVSARQ